MPFGGYTDGNTKNFAGNLMSTGDVGHFDEDGRLFVSGRDDDMIVSGGENVFPRELEDALATHPDIADVVVTGIPDETYGQRARRLRRSRARGPSSRTTTSSSSPRTGSPGSPSESLGRERHSGARSARCNGLAPWRIVSKKSSNSRW